MASVSISATDLKAQYLFGVTLVNPTDSVTMPDSIITALIERNESVIESLLNIHLSPFQIEDEPHDYYTNDYYAFVFTQLYQFPVISIQEIKAIYPTGQAIVDFPSQWWKIYHTHGQVQIVPTAGTLSQVMIGMDGQYLPLLYSLRYLPQLFHFKYIAGFGTGAVPKDITHLVALRTTNDILNIVGQFPLGIGIQSLSLGIDGLSQSVSSTKSGGSAYQKRIDENNLVIKDLEMKLKDFYTGIKWTVL